MKTRLLFILLFAISSFSIKAQSFMDINASLPPLVFSISSFGDCDEDGDLDLYLSGMDENFAISGGLYINENGSFTLSTESGIPALYMGSADWGDIDGDGDLDIVLIGQNGSFVDIAEVYRNDGFGSFTNLNSDFTAIEQGEVRFADIDNDGDLDISLTGIAATANITKLYENDGTGAYTELTDVVLPGMNTGRIKWADYDKDEDNDFVLSGYDDESIGGFFTEIYTNNGDGTFSISGIPLHKGWLGDTEWGDYNDDGNIDLIISGTGGDGTDRFTLLYKNNGDGTFEELDIGIPGVSHSSIEWGDFDSDGDLDLFVVGETTTPGDGNSISKIYNNEGNDTFTDSGVDNLNFSYYGDADAGDFDNDGEIDLVITGYSAADYAMSSSTIYKNTTNINSVSTISSNFSISPVPAKDFVKILMDEPIQTIQVYSITGQLVLSKSLNSQAYKLNIENLESGIYVLKLSTTTQNLSSRFIIE